MNRVLALLPSLSALTIVSQCPAVQGAKNIGHLGDFPKWSKVEVVLHGPDRIGLGTPNPFPTDVDVLFSGPGGRACTVPAFYDGDGQGGMDGNVWKARFSPDATGAWSFQSSSKLSALNAYTGSFLVTHPPDDAPRFFTWGRLEYVGQHYLKFRDGPYWFKAGADEPENFLGSAFGEDDWTRKKAEVAYLAGKGINCMYIMTHTLDGDGKDVWPWYGQTQTEAKAHPDRFDVAKLAKWEDVFLHIQNSGIAIHLVLEDDSAWTGYDRPLYYREIVARFAYLPALYFNICEEHNERYSLSQALEHAAMLRNLDPFKQPIAIHNVNTPNSAYLNNPAIDTTSVQGYKEGDALAAFDAVVNWRSQSAASGKKLVVSFDEYMNQTGNTPQARTIARKTAWGVALGGGIVELFSAGSEPLQAFSEYSDFWDDLRHLRTFMEQIPFWEMTPDRSLVSNGLCFCGPGLLYAVYLPDGGSAAVDLSSARGRFSVDWYNPKDGVFHQGKVVKVIGGAVVSIGSAPFSGESACLVRKEDFRIEDIRRVTADSLQISWPAAHGESYTLERAQSLLAAGWLHVAGEYILAGDMALQTVEFGPDQRGFFRVATVGQ